MPTWLPRIPALLGGIYRVQHYAGAPSAVRVQLAPQGAFGGDSLVG